MIRLIFFILFLLVALPFGLLAQITMYPHEGGIKRPSENARVRSTQTPVVPVDLPFWDDFSRVSEGDNPADSLWLDKSMVIVTSGQAIYPPSINVVTFDGLDPSGIPYNPAPGDEQVFGYRDTLVSQPVMLDVVPANQTDSVYLSFSFQAGGNGEPPDEADFLRIEFKDDDNEWHEAAVLTIDDAPDPTKFYDTLIQVVDTLFHDSFQFRIISFGRKSGRYDTWHVDYVYLNQHRHANDRVFPDRTLSAPLGPIFGDYYQMPIKHFFKAPVVTAASFFMWNLYDIITVVEYNTSIKSKKYYENTPPIENEMPLDETEPMFPVINEFPPLSLAEVTMKTLPDPVLDRPGVFDPTAERIGFTIEVSVDKADNKPVDDDTDYHPKYTPIDFRFNDTLQVNYALDSAYAYDDGTAEYSAGLVRAGNELAYRFDNIHSGQDSIINGVLIYFPEFAGSASATSINFFILSDNNGEPGSILYEDVLTIDRTSGNEFTPYSLLQGILIDGPFYIGYSEPSTGSVRVGLDKSNNTGDRMYFRVNSTSNWILNDEVTGSLMIRPTFGPHTVVVSGLPEDKPLLSIFPNPNRGEFYIEGQVSDLQLLSATGQPVPFSVENVDDKVKITASINSLGVYIVKYMLGQELQTQKILFIR